MSNYGKDKDFECCPKGYVLQKGDRMRRTDPEYSASLNWFEIHSFDIGRKASYFDGSGFIVQRRLHKGKK